MALAALIAAYEEADEGGLRALIPLAGRPLVEYQARCVAATGANPIVLLVDQPPPSLLAAADRLRADGLHIVIAESATEAAARFEADTLVLQLADGIAPDMADLMAVAEAEGPTILTVPDDEAHDPFERIDLAQRWAGLSLVEGREIGATAAMLGYWDLGSTLLRRMVQAGAAFRASEEGEGRGPLLVDSIATASQFSRRMLAASKGARSDWVARWLLPPLEDWLTARLAGTTIRPSWIFALSIGLALGAAAAFLTGHGWIAMALLVLTLPLDLVARRVAALRLRPLSSKALLPRLVEPAFVAAMAALALWQSEMGARWEPLFVMGTALLFGEAMRPLRSGNRRAPILFDRRPAILLLLPFAALGIWLPGMIILAGYAAASFFIAQRIQD